MRRIALVASIALASVFAPAPLRAQATGFRILQPMADHVTQIDDPVLHQRVYYVPTMLDYIHWGRLHTAASRPVVTVPSGSLVTFDVVSHEGILEDQGRDPVRFFGQRGIPRDQVLDDAIAVARSSIPHSLTADGPHVISPPVAVEGAVRGDILRIDVVALEPRVPYGVTSMRHGRGALPGVFPPGPPAEPNADAAHPERYHDTSIVISLQRQNGAWVNVLHARGRDIHIPFRPFLGTMGVAADSATPPHSTPPAYYGGNIDLRHLVAGSTLYLPVQVPGALFYVADSHFSQGNGEVDATAIEASLRATVRLTRIPAGTVTAPLRGRLASPFAETPDYWIAIGLSPDLNVALQNAVQQGIDFLSGRFGISPLDAYAYESTDVDFDVTEFVDITRGVHGLIPKRAFPGSPRGAERRRTNGAAVVATRASQRRSK
jgi:acetamidase/formamidase